MVASCPVIGYILQDEKRSLAARKFEMLATLFRCIVMFESSLVNLSMFSFFFLGMCLSYCTVWMPGKLLDQRIRSLSRKEIQYQQMANELANLFGTAYSIFKHNSTVKVMRYYDLNILKVSTRN